MIGFPENQIYCTSLNLDLYKLSDQEKKVLKKLALEIASQPILSWYEGIENAEGLSDESKQLVKRLDTIFWKEISEMGIGNILSDVNPIGGFEKAKAVKDSLKKTGFNLSEILYVGDSITDVQALELVKNAKGAAISFNGNRYSIKAAKWACMCGNTSLIGAIARLLTLKGMNALDELMSFSDSDQAEGTMLLDAFASMAVESSYLEPLRSLTGKDMPRLFLINNDNICDVIKDSEYIRKNVRGLAIGDLG
jgi:energy-converting hydrogenase A subunit R